jgi:hypothetical protein
MFTRDRGVPYLYSTSIVMQPESVPDASVAPSSGRPKRKTKAPAYPQPLVYTSLTPAKRKAADKDPAEKLQDLVTSPKSKLVTTNLSVNLPALRRGLFYR